MFDERGGVGGAKSMEGVVAELHGWVLGRVGTVLVVGVRWMKKAEATEERGRAESEVEIYRRRELHSTQYGDVYTAKSLSYRSNKQKAG